MGYNADGQLGFEKSNIANWVVTAMSQPTPKFSRIFCGSYHTMGITDDGELWTWEWNHFKQLGNFLGFFDNFSNFSAFHLLFLIPSLTSSHPPPSFLLSFSFFPSFTSSHPPPSFLLSFTHTSQVRLQAAPLSPTRSPSPLRP
jgi:hypothetical protein